MTLYIEDEVRKPSHDYTYELVLQETDLIIRIETQNDPDLWIKLTIPKETLLALAEQVKEIEDFYAKNVSRHP